MPIYIKSCKYMRPIFGDIFMTKIGSAIQAPPSTPGGDAKPAPATSPAAPAAKPAEPAPTVKS
jgi:hypothetical protein